MEKEILEKEIEELRKINKKLKEVNSFAKEELKKAEKKKLLWNVLYWITLFGLPSLVLFLYYILHLLEK
jgi:hypothetical protein